MKYALVNDEPHEAQPGFSGKCKSCGHLTVAKCGKIKIWHWAHSGKRMCDPWWENETEWHRAWKNSFPINWQEVIHHDKTGERHIADVKTVTDWVLEFQHSFLKAEERDARNAFYGKLVWVVDGMRRTRDKTQFFELLNQSILVTQSPHMRRIYLDKCALAKEWSGIQAPVFFDFGEEVLWCLLPTNQNMWGYIVAFPRREFIALHNTGVEQTNNFDECLNQLNTLTNLISQQLTQQQQKNRQDGLLTMRKGSSRGRF